MSPNFLIIGAPRCGTTFLTRNLASHPEVYLASGTEDYSALDLHFFDTDTKKGDHNFKKGVDWYLGQFADAGEAVACGEKTANYLESPGAAQLIYSILGDIKIVVAIRDPITRALSHYRHSRHRLPLTQGFDELVENDLASHAPKVIGAGEYHKLLQPYFQLFGPENIHVVVQDDVGSSAVKVMSDLCEFLGIERSYLFPFIESQINPSSSSFLAHGAARLGYNLNVYMPGVYSALLNGPFERHLKRLIMVMRGKGETRTVSKSHVQQSEISETTRERLREYYRDDVKQLSWWLCRDLASLWWS